MGRQPHCRVRRWADSSAHGVRQSQRLGIFQSSTTEDRSPSAPFGDRPGVSLNLTPGTNATPGRLSSLPSSPPGVAYDRNKLRSAIDSPCSIPELRKRVRAYLIALTGADP